jgi:hypothetical protein
MSLYSILDNVLPAGTAKNKGWDYGYNKKHDIIVISKDGTIGDIYEINGLKIALPSKPKDIPKGINRWEPVEYPKELARLKTIFDWNAQPNEFKVKWVDFIQDAFEKRDIGTWFINRGKPTYITGSHYMYLQWSKIDVGLPDFRESNRIFWIFWEACKADDRCFGMCYLKNRRSGFSFMSSSEIVNQGTLSKDAKLGILSKTGADAKEMFTGKVVPIQRHYPFFFKPIQDGMDNPKTELSFRIPAKKITKKNMSENDADEITGLDTTIDWQNTADNSYDGQKLLTLVHDESGKWLAPNNIKNNWRVTKTCLRLGSRIIGKCLMGSTVNALAKGGQNFKDMYYDSNPSKRDKNGQTKSGLYSLFIPMDYNYEGFIDEYGHAVIEDPVKPIMGIDGRMIEIGVITYWNNEIEALKSDPDALNEQYRQYPRTESHAFRDESKASIYNLTKIYQQIDSNEGLMRDRVLTRGYFSWRGGVQDSEVIWTPDPRGRFLTSWIPPKDMQNRFIMKEGKKHPANEDLGAFGCDPYDISGVVGGGGSNGALHGLTAYNMDPSVPSNFFFLEYIARPATAEIFFEDVLMACHFYGMPILAENNKARLLYHFKNRGYRKYSINRPDKPFEKLSPTEKELGGVPNSSEDMIQTHAAGIGSYIEQYVGYDTEGEYRSPEFCGEMYFNKTLEDWAKFTPSNRTKHDASISSGLAIMAVRRHSFRPQTKKSKISINFVKYNNNGHNSEIIK